MPAEEWQITMIVSHVVTPYDLLSENCEHIAGFFLQTGAPPVGKEKESANNGIREQVDQSILEQYYQLDGSISLDKHHTQMLYCSILAIQTYTYTQGALVCSGVGFYFTATSE